MPSDTPVEVPTLYPALREAVGWTVDADHPVGRMLRLKEPDAGVIARWLDGRYSPVFLDDRVRWEGDRLRRLAEGLRDARSFQSADAEVQTIANLLRDRAVMVVAQAEGKEHGSRTCDFLIEEPCPVEVEVRALLGPKQAVEEARIEKSLLDRLLPAARAHSATLVFRVRRVRGEDGGRLVLDPRAERRLALRLAKIAQEGAWRQRPIQVAVLPDGEPMIVDGTRSLADALATVEIKTSPLAGFVVGYGGLEPPSGEDEVREALHAKRRRRQNTGSRPWVVVLDLSGVPLLDEELVDKAILAEMNGSRNLSAVVVQHRRITTPGFGLLPGDPLLAQFESTIVVNSGAAHPLPEDIVRLFEVSEACSLR